MKRYLLLEEYDVHVRGDEMFCAVRLQWIPVPALHIGEPVGDSMPCRRLIDEKRVVITFIEAGK